MAEVPTGVTKLPLKGNRVTWDGSTVHWEAVLRSSGADGGEQFLEGWLARDVALEAVGHVTMEDPRLRLLLGQVAIRLGDRRLLGEAKAFLDFFNFEPWRRKLGEVEESGVLDFAGP